MFTFKMFAYYFFLFCMTLIDKEAFLSDFTSQDRLHSRGRRQNHRRTWASGLGDAYRDTIDVGETK